MHIDTGYHKQPGVSLTPLIDVVFILLVFFMLATRFGHWQDLPVSIAPPQATTSASDDPLLIEVMSDTEVRLRGHSMDVSMLEQRLAGMPHAAVRVSARAGVSVQSLLRVADLVHRAGISDAEVDLLP